MSASAAPDREIRSTSSHGGEIVAIEAIMTPNPTMVASDGNSNRRSESPPRSARRYWTTVQVSNASASPQVGNRSISCQGRDRPAK